MKYLKIVILILFSCNRVREKKICYLKDEKGHIIYGIVVGRTFEEACIARDLYANYWGISINEFDLKANWLNLRFINGRQVDVLKYYPNQQIARIRYLPERQVSLGRVHSDVETFYIPMLLLHDSWPLVDTIKFKPYKWLSSWLPIYRKSLWLVAITEN